MKILNKIFPFIFIVIWQLPVYGVSTEKGDSLRFEVLMNNKMLDDIHLDISFTNSLNITSNHLILLSSTDKFYLLGWGGIKSIGLKATGIISSFAYTSDGFLMIVNNNELCYLKDSIGHFARLYQLPSNNMGITAGKNVMYLYDRVKEQKSCALYILAKGHKYLKLFEIPTPILSVCDMNGSILFSTENKIYSINSKNNNIKALVALPNDKEIKSIAVDTSLNRIFFSTENMVYTLKDSTAEIITDKFGGILKYFNGGLIIFNPEKKYLIRIVGIENKIATKNKVLMIAGKGTQTSNADKKSIKQKDSVLQVKLVPSDKIIPQQPSTAKVTETVKQPAMESSGSKSNEIPSQPKTFYIEKFISSTSESLEQGKIYILKKDYSLTTGIFMKLPEGSILKLVGTDAGSITSWEVVQPLDGSSALIDSKLYTYFKQDHLWMLQPQTESSH
jgi:hypothetical protein